MSKFAVKPTRRELELVKLADEIEILEVGNVCAKAVDRMAGRRCRTKLTDSEAAFQKRAKEKGLRCVRAGWPDFLVMDPETGKAYGVEVKSGDDDVRLTQAKMFAALETLGIPVYVWHPGNPRLVPWRKFVADRLAAPKLRVVARRQAHRNPWVRTE